MIPNLHIIVGLSSRLAQIPQ